MAVLILYFVFIFLADEEFNRIASTLANIKAGDEWWRCGFAFENLYTLKIVDCEWNIRIDGAYATAVYTKLCLIVVVYICYAADIGVIAEFPVQLSVALLYKIKHIVYCDFKCRLVARIFVHSLVQNWPAHEIESLCILNKFGLVTDKLLQAFDVEVSVVYSNRPNARYIVSCSRIVYENATYHTACNTSRITSCRCKEICAVFCAFAYRVASVVIVESEVEIPYRTEIEFRVIAFFVAINAPALVVISAKFVCQNMTNK